MSPPHETVINTSSLPPAYSSGYGTIEVHHHHHHVVRDHDRARHPCSRSFLVIVLIAVAFSGICFVAWNFYNLSECEKNRLPWDKPCKDWLGKDGFL
ncbi:hypothetical protein DM02DRAFT_609394 [Periconia macrospinosa]|uniref:Transmembrane protein n=1 Tax=Periconia macrospinosa TaxID=97972 RepID=A0A2V1E919_9PLEO|nr:hypothetical protein DM02DRAFT_609394 [Periconia macrospinosa]